ncbi:MAG TPA: OmpA family protein [Thermoanaerobaculia bacterium]|nr:OmpA family protein [Thermoanaerobaculia bacterium]
MDRKLLIVVTVVAVAASGCTTKKYTRDYVAGETRVVNERIDGVEEQVEQNQTRLSTHERRIEETAGEARQASATAREALERAQEAGRLAEGKFLYEVLLTDQDVRFGFDRTELSPEAKAALDTFAESLKSENKGVYVEIQGHTDAVGQEAYNEELGLERAEAVRRYLNREHGVPLHRMNVISYGEAAPISDNGSREGRAQNRRVALVVLA